LRDNRHGQGEAERALREYAARVPAGDDPYTEAEALASVRQAYAKPPREPWDRGGQQQAPRSSNGTHPRAYKVKWDKSGKGAPKLVLPPSPDARDVAGLCACLTCVFNLDPSHPITGGSREGLTGPEGHAVLRRAAATALRFEPIRRIGTPAKLTEDLRGWLLPTDGEVYGFKAEHAGKIEHVVRMLCGAAGVLSAEEEIAAVVGTFLRSAEAVEGHTTHRHRRTTLRGGQGAASRVRRENGPAERTGEVPR
jgi:hypothetical protein